MSRVAGFTVLVLGLGFGGYVYYPELAQYDADARSAAERLVKEEKARSEALVVPASSPRDPRTFSPQSPLFAAARSSAATDSVKTESVKTESVKAAPGGAVKALPQTAPASTPAVQAKVEPVQTERAPSEGAWAATVTPAAGEASVPRLSSKPRDDVSRERLAR